MRRRLGRWRRLCDSADLSQRLKPNRILNATSSHRGEREKKSLVWSRLSGLGGGGGKRPLEATLGRLLMAEASLRALLQGSGCPTGSEKEL